MKRPVIGIPTQTLEGAPAHLPRSWIMSQRYVRALTSVGAIPWLVPLLEDDRETLRCMYDQLDGLFLMGGVDVDPSTYGEQRHAACERTDIDRDRTELVLARWAMEDDKPVLGVCRGLQLLNVARGGTLWQDLAAQRPGSIKHDYLPFGGPYTREYLAHAVRLAERTRLEDLYGARTVKVNSMHHQGIKVLGEGLVPTAHAPDGLIEAVEDPRDRFVVAVQWHPEVLIDDDPATHRLFGAFIEAATEYRYTHAIA